MAKFFLDRSVPESLAAALRTRGHDVLTVVSGPRPLEIADDDLLLNAAMEQRIVLTGNRRDFERLHEQFESRSQKHFGIVTCSQPNSDSEAKSVARLIDSAVRAQLHLARQMENRLIHISSNQQRRSVPESIQMRIVRRRL